MQSKFRTRAGGRKFLVFFFGIFALVGAVGFYFLGILPAYRLIRAQSWQEVPCRVVSSDVAVSSSSDGDTYRVDITYAYRYNGREYQSDRYNFSMGYSSGYGGKKEVVDAHPAGMKTVCYVDANDPSEAVLDRRPGLYLLLGLFPLPFLLVGIFGPTFLARATNRQARLRADPARAVGAMDLGSDSPNPRVLKPRTSAKAKLIGVSFFAILWNGIIWSILAFAILPGFRGGGGDLFGLIFMVPFVLVGLAAAGGVVYMALAMANPVPTLELGSTQLYPGARTKLAWRIDGNVYKMDNFRISLEGRETVTYRRGTNTYTDHHTFCDAALYESRMAEDFRNGSAEFKIPDSAMPSFGADHNKIEWHLHVHGSIPRWPDVDNRYPLHIAAEGGRP
ncbi:MAG: DUF3592 domain-containing protein [Chitinivibrionales bacterium]|nr:DUF3592 domain-containing protein [Chitinivibrionales bacterium]